MRPRFSEMSPLEAVQAAIAIERRNSDLYRNLSQLFQSYDGGLGAIFDSMAQEEIQHRIELESFLQKQFPGEQPSASSDPDIEEVVEAPDLDEPEVFIFDNITVQDAIAMAERAEAHAHQFYQSMRKQVNDPGLRSLCCHMAEVEAGHQQKFANWKKNPPAKQARSRPSGGTV